MIPLMNRLKTIAFILFPTSVSASLITDLHFYSGIAAKAGYSYFIEGNGFLNGDKLRLEDATQTSTFLLNLSVVNENTVKFQFPDGLHSGEYNMTLIRDDMAEDLGTTSFQVVEEMPKGSSVIAHRGYWIKSGASQNSRASFQNAIDLGVYGSETDVWLTNDGYLMCNHDAGFNGVTIQTSSFEQVKHLELSNGETIPTLAEFLYA